MRLFLHIGRHKTGTTAIQTFLDRNHDRLLAKGVLYPVAGRLRDEDLTPRIFHHELFRSLLEGEEGRATRLFDDLDREIARTSPSIVVLSSEFLSRERVGVEDLERVRARLPAIATTVIVYLRRQDDAIASRYAEKIRTGNLAWPETIDSIEQRMDWDYRKPLDAVRLVFGAENMVVKLYDAEKKNLVGGFLTACGIDLSTEAEGTRERVRPLWMTTEFLRFANALPRPLQRFAKGAALRADALARRTPFARLLDRPLPLTDAERDRILNRFDAANREIEARYFSGASVFPRPRESAGLRAD